MTRDGGGGSCGGDRDTSGKDVIFVCFIYWFVVLTTHITGVLILSRMQSKLACLESCSLLFISRILIEDVSGVLTLQYRQQRKTRNPAFVCVCVCVCVCRVFPLKTLEMVYATPRGIKQAWYIKINLSFPFCIIYSFICLFVCSFRLKCSNTGSHIRVICNYCWQV